MSKRRSDWKSDNQWWLGFRCLLFLYRGNGGDDGDKTTSATLQLTGCVNPTTTKLCFPISLSRIDLLVIEN
jgi:hypothetical protein